MISTRKSQITIPSRRTFQPLLLQAVVVTIFLGIILQPLPSFAEYTFIPWEEQVFAQVAREYGSEAAGRLRKVHDLVIKHFNKPDSEKLKLVNDYTNTLPWIADAVHWQQQDYWATPLETLTTFGGDCEDLAIMKYTFLRFLGIPDDNLGFSYVVTEKGERHMVLVYKANKGQPILILDNINPEILPAKDRPDLLAVYIFQNDGKFFVIKDTGKANRTLLSEKENQKFQKWLTVKKRAFQNNEKYRPYNSGRSLFPEWMEKTGAPTQDVQAKP